MADVPATLGVVLNCQLLTALAAGGGGFEGGLEVEPEVEPEVLCPPPQPQRRRAESSHKVLAQRFIELLPMRFGVADASGTCAVANRNSGDLRYDISLVLQHLRSGPISLAALIF